MNLLVYCLSFLDFETELSSTPSKKGTSSKRPLHGFVTPSRQPPSKRQDRRETPTKSKTVTCKNLFVETQERGDLPNTGKGHALVPEYVLISMVGACSNTYSC